MHDEPTELQFDEDADPVQVQETIDQLRNEQEMAEEFDGLYDDMTAYD